jgi:hypothetical protein
MTYTEDLDPLGRSSSDAELVEAAILHRLMVDKLPLVEAPGGEVDWGRNVRRWVGTITTQDRADAKAPELVMVIGRDPRVDNGSIRVDITLLPNSGDPSAYTFEIAVDAQTVRGVPISMVLGVSGVTVEKLAQGGAAS